MILIRVMSAVAKLRKPDAPASRGARSGATKQGTLPGRQTGLRVAYPAPHQ